MDDHGTLAFWLYASRSTLLRGHSHDAVEQIVEIFRRRNLDLEVTGALIFTGHCFAQHIEGPSAGVHARRSGTMRDVRHSDICTVSEGVLGERRFGDWSLAYSGESAPFDRLISLAQGMTGGSGETLLMEMIRRFTGQVGRGTP